jgi:hypothetical protein
MRIFCVYRSGGDYDVRYVVALQNAVEQYIGVEHSFICLTNVPEELAPYSDCIEVRELEFDLPGWWSKIELFNPKHSSNEISVFFDLDVLILKPIEEFIEVCEKVRFYNAPLMLRSADKLGEQMNWPSSSIMCWADDMMEEVFYEFFRQGDVIEKSHKKTSRAGQQTDQGFIREYVTPQMFQDHLPKRYVLYKVKYVPHPELLELAFILNWTGRPRFHKMGFEFQHIQSVWDSRHETIVNHG